MLNPTVFSAYVLTNKNNVDIFRSKGEHNIFLQRSKEAMTSV